MVKKNATGFGFSQLRCARRQAQDWHRAVAASAD
jgi:hypothetical protein